MGLCTSKSTAFFESPKTMVGSGTETNLAQAPSSSAGNAFESIYSTYVIWTLNDILQNDEVLFPRINGVVTPIEEQKRIVMITGRTMIDTDIPNKYALSCSPVFSEATVHYESIVYEADMTLPELGWQVIGQENKYSSYYLVDPHNPNMRIEVIGDRIITSPANEFIDPIDINTGISIEAMVLPDLCAQRFNAIQHAFVKKYLDIVELEMAMTIISPSIGIAGSGSSETEQSSSSVNQSHNIDQFIPRPAPRTRSCGSSKRCYQLTSPMKLSEKTILLGEQICVLGVLNKRLIQSGKKNTVTEKNTMDNGLLVENNDSVKDNLPPLQYQFYLTPIDPDIIESCQWTAEQKEMWFSYCDTYPSSTMFVTNSPNIVQLCPVPQISFDPQVKISKRVPSSIGKEIIKRRKQPLPSPKIDQNRLFGATPSSTINKQYSGSTTSVSTTFSACGSDGSLPTNQQDRRNITISMLNSN